MMTNSEIKRISLDGFKDGFEAAINALAANMGGTAKEAFLRDMADVQEFELQKAARIWDAAFSEAANA